MRTGFLLGVIKNALILIVEMAAQFFEYIKDR